MIALNPVIGSRNGDCGLRTTELKLVIYQDIATSKQTN